MKNVFVAVVASFTLVFAVTAFARTPAAVPAPHGESCKAAGQSCSDKEDCCSRMCRKDNGKCA